jgi:chromosome segregation protein
MKLKKIYVCGFKSIADPLNLTFGEGVTCIVGPNGCGKSNISDAVKWVLGEQNPRNLRANKMEDLIFGGTAARKSEGMTEIRLTIDNEDGALQLPYAEIEVGRRLYRTGESEYRINKEIVRRKDIVDLFANTGVGTHTYSFLEQGRVDGILRAKPVERREIFEEASGITKYRMRQDEALRKLKRTDQDLQRIGDITGELARQVRSLKYQANKAERYHEFQHRLHDFELARIHRVSRDLIHQLQESEAEIKQNRDLKASLEERLKEAGAELESATERVEAARLALGESERKRNVLQSEIQRFDDQLAHSRQMEAELLQQETRGKELAQALTSERDQIDQKIENEKAREDSLRRRIADLEIEENLLVQQEKEGSLEFENARRDAAEAAKAVSGIERKIEAARREIENIEKQLENLVEENDRLVVEKETAQKELSEIDEKVVAGQTFHEGTQEDRKREETTRNEIRERLQALETEIETKRTTNEGIHREMSRLSHRLDSLKELQAHHEGQEEGVKKALERRERGEQPFDKIHGLLIEQVRVQPGYEDAIETALSVWFGGVLCTNREEAAALLRALRDTESGRVTCIPTEMVRAGLNRFGFQTSGETPDWVRAQGAIPARNVVEIIEVYRDILAPVLQKTVVVEGIEELSRIAEQLDEGWIAVTRNGEIARFPGIMSGGKTVATGFLRRQSEIDEISGRVEAIEKDLEERDRQLQEVQALRQEWVADLKRRETVIHDLVIRIAAKQEELQGLAQLREKVERTLNRIDEQVERISTKRHEQSNRKAEIEQSVDEASTELERLVVQAEETRQGYIRIEDALTLLREKHAHHRESFITLRKDHERCLSEIDQGGQRRGQIEERLKELRKEEEERARKIAESNQHKEQAEQSLKGLFEQVDRVEEDHAEFEANLAREREKHSVSTTNQKQVREMLSEASEKIQKLEVSSHRAQVEKENLERRLTEELQATWDECREKAETIQGLPETIEDLSKAIADIRDKIGKMGEVNPLALEEYEEQSERLNFLTQQQEDLEKAKSSLQRTIAEVKRTARKQFLDTFEAVRHNFNRIFRKVMGGGRADLILLDPSDVLGSGIEIVAQPPGKKLQSITLFSGGEKSMTAISLMFAIYQIKASPFCFLDEVDAALDDANVDRFARLLTDYRKTSQFIIVTHNKHTMAAADRIYGVTMAKPGISSVMAMEFENRAEYNLDPLPEQEEDVLPEQNYDIPERTEGIESIETGELFPEVFEEDGLTEKGSTHAHPIELEAEEASDLVESGRSE